MVAIIRLDEAETRRWAWSLIEERHQRMAIELLDSDRTSIGQSTALVIFVAELASLHPTSFVCRGFRHAEPTELAVIAVGRMKPGKRTSRIDWRHTINPVAALQNPLALRILLDNSETIGAWRKLTSGERAVRIRKWDSDTLVYALLTACDPGDVANVKHVVEMSAREPDLSHTSQILAQERDAIISAMKISGNEDNIADLKIGPVDGNDPTPFLNRVEPTEPNRDGGRMMPIRQHEDSVIGVDARNFLDWISGETGHAAAMTFENKQGRRLTVINANRLGIERTVGADLVYYNPICRAYVLVQYKMMATRGNRNKASNWVFRPDRQFRDQLTRLQNVEVSHSTQNSDITDHNTYRLSPSLTYFKFCRHDTGLDPNTRLMNGYYASTTFTDLLLASSRGPRRGERIDGGTLRERGLDNSAFTSLVRTSLIGSSGATTEELCRVMEASLAGDRSVVFAMPELNLQ